MLDQINSYLDDLEERNDSLNGKLLDLMESNRQARLEFRAQLNGSEPKEEEKKEDAPADEEKTADPSEDSGDGKWWTKGITLDIFRLS